MKSGVIVIAAAALLVSAIPARAHHRHHIGAPHHKAHAAKVHYGGKPGLGYWRRGPETGYGFGFASYKRDPFGSDDYFDGGRCYYLHHRNFCAANKIFDGFR